MQTGHAEAVRLFIVCQLDKARHRESLYCTKIRPFLPLCPQGAVAGRRGDRRDAGEHLQGDREGRATRWPAGQVRWDTRAAACAYLPDMCALLKHERQEIPLLLLLVLRFRFQKDPTDLFYFGLLRYLVKLSAMCIKFRRKSFTNEAWTFVACKQP